MRAFGKGYEAFYERVEGHGVDFVRFDKDIRVEQHNGRLAVLVTDVYSGKPKKTLVDMVILSTGMEAQPDQHEVGVLFGVSCGADGFFIERHPKLAPVETVTDGVFLAGACQGPKDIPDSVAQGGAAAAAALSLMDAGSVLLEPFTSYVVAEDCAGCRNCESACPYHAIEMVMHDQRLAAFVNEVICKGCGTCVAACPSGAARHNGFTDAQLIAEITGALEALR
ncbi:MAG: 4Fe-4S binding protein, partial [Anaerolineales bacterium]|nr:4Fe-4S binding protein [Anaerolineales bacterium]